MTSHPYISGAGNITQMVSLLRKNFPAIVNSDTVKKLGIAPKNESYVINALQFIGIIDEEGKRTDRGHEVLTTHDEGAFKKAFESLIRESYKDLFDLRGDDAWTMDKDAVIGYFRSADKTSDVIGARQATLFQSFRALAGHGPANTKNEIAPKAVARASNPKKVKVERPAHASTSSKMAASVTPSTREMALTVRIEINLPAEASAETYDSIFKSIRANLLHE
jgi:hypothetical protein